MSSLLKAGIAIVTSVAVVTLALAQSVRIRGTVRDTTASVVPNAAVKIHCGNFSATAKTDSNGEFTFSQVALHQNKFALRVHHGKDQTGESIA